MKYIDADKLKQEIEKRFWAYGTPLHDDEVTTKADEILSFIDSLQQEQPDFPTTDEQVKEFLATHPKIKVPEKYKNPDWLWKRQEQPDEHYTKRNALFDQCMENCDPKVMKEVSDNVDKLRAISTPAEEDWFEIDKEWEKEDNK